MVKPTLLVLAAGMGSRYGGLKQMAGVGPNGETLLEYAVHDALAAGFGKVVFVIRPDFADTFHQGVVAKMPPQIQVDVVFQEVSRVPSGCRAPDGRSKPWGTGHAVWVARAQVQGPFAVINADDYYGQQAYRKAAEFVQKTSPGHWPLSFALVAFELGRTLSRFGGVSRGICRVDELGSLLGVTETTGIQADHDRIVSDRKEGPELSPATPTSMNFFVFMPGIFEFLEEQFRDFLEEHGDDPRSEFFLPSAVGVMIARSQARVSVMGSSDQWMGVTYAEDRAVVIEHLSALHAAGLYPARLG